MTTSYALVKQEAAHAAKVKELRAERDALKKILEDLVEATEWFREVRRVHEWIEDTWAWSERFWRPYGEISDTYSNAQQGFLIALQRAKDAEVAA
jgi:hypothetical protein